MHRVDAFGAMTRLSYDQHHLLLVKTTDAAGNTTETASDYKTLMPRYMTDTNNNVTKFSYDVFGRISEIAHLGKSLEKIGLHQPTEDLSENLVRLFFKDPLSLASKILGTATTRFLTK